MGAETARVGLKDGALLAGARLVACAVVWATGFRSVSDDDFARVSIAQAFASEPKLDPTGTSWLPLPFWIHGGVMMLGGRSLMTARIVSVLLGVLATTLVYVAARWLTGPDVAPQEARRSALFAGLFATLLPWSARLGVATVPELPTAALTLLAVASLGTPSKAARAWGALALLAATLSRYEPWPVAVVFAVLTLRDALREKKPFPYVPLALTALLGPLSWLAWNALAHGHATAFIERVAAYKQALGSDGDGSPLTRLFDYPFTAVRHEPELFAMLGVTALMAWRIEGFDSLELKRFRRPLGAVLAMVVLLSLASIRDAAPTHHPERALLVALLFAATLLGRFSAALVARTSREEARTRLLQGLVMLALAGAFRWRFTGTLTFVERPNEEAVGAAIASRTAPGERVLLEVTDYGFFAVEAASGRPEDIVHDRTWDPRVPLAPSSFDDARSLRARLAESHAKAFVTAQRDVALSLGARELASSGPLALFETPQFAAQSVYPAASPSP